MADILRRGAAAAAGLIVLGVGAAAGPSMSTIWSSTTLPLEDCKQRAEQAARKSGFRSIKVLEFSVYAERDEYAAMVRCTPEKEAVFVTVAGPRMDATSRYAKDIGDAFGN